MRLHFGSGSYILKDYINIDITDEYGAEVLCDLDKPPYPFKDNSADEILCEMTLEHIFYPSKAISEFHRIIKPDGIIKISVPHFTSFCALNGDQHIRTFGTLFFYNFLPTEKDIWGVERNGRWRENSDIAFEKVKVKIVFPQGKLKLLSLPFQIIFNLSRRMQVLYELFFSLFYRADDLIVRLEGKK